jgi:hypothetical protein
MSSLNPQRISNENAHRHIALCNIRRQVLRRVPFLAFDMIIATGHGPELHMTSFEPTTFGEIAPQQRFKK